MRRRRTLEGLVSDVRPGRWRIGPRDSAAWAGIRRAGRAGRITAAERRDYDELCRREALGRGRRALAWVLRHPRAMAAVLVVLGAVWLVADLVAELGAARTEAIGAVVLVAGGILLFSRGRRRPRRRSRR